MATAGVTFAPELMSPQRPFQFEIRLPTIPGADRELVEPLAMEVQVGDYVWSELTRVRYGIQARNYPGLLNVKDFTIRFLRTQAGDFLSTYLYAWRSLVVKNGFYFAKNHYARDVEIRLLDNTDEINTYLMLRGCWPLTVPEYSLSFQTDTNPVYCLIPFNVDRVVVLDKDRREVFGTFGENIR